MTWPQGRERGRRHRASSGRASASGSKSRPRNSASTVPAGRSALRNRRPECRGLKHVEDVDFDREPSAQSGGWLFAASASIVKGERACVTWAVSSANMGSGLFSGGGFGQSAYIREPFLQLTTTTSSWMTSTVPTGAGWDTDCYDQSGILSNGGTNWVRWFYLGGPGADNAGCN
jgi:hypothetical protein